jgi:penicillin-binding protein 2
MKTALQLDQVTGGKAAETMGDTFSQLGLNKLSDLNIGTEAVGYFPVPKDKQAKGLTWLPGYLLNASIGQGEVKMTPLGAAGLTSWVANKGTMNKQSLIKSQDNQENLKIQQTKFDINSKHFETINEGMQCAAKRDNSVTQYDPKKYVDVSVKTGTAETGQMKNGKEVIHSWEISFAPSDKPEIAMSVFIENGQHGYHGGYISREFYKSWSQELRTVKN